MRKIILMTIFTLFFAQPVFAAYPTSGAAQDAYCQVPPYITTNVKPNINMVLDFSGSMQFPAYLDCSAWGGYDSSKVANCGTYSTPSASFLYNTAKNYYGNFKNNLYYKYNAAGYFEENAGCTDTDKKGKISTGCISGNLLNWAITTRTDVLRKALTGGRVKSSTTDIIESEGSRYVFTDTALQCKFTVTAGTTLTRLLKIENRDATHPCAIGTSGGSTYNMDVKTTTPTTDITGLVQSMYPSMVDLELSVYNTTVNVAYRTGKNKPVADYLTAINTELAYNGTPTGEALREAQYYFQQSSSMTATGETTVIGKADYLKDPFYETGNLPAYCKKAFVLLISDGEWNGSVDPVSPAYSMRMTDLRLDAAMTDKQVAKTYAVYAFGDGVNGRQAMITTAIFGGFDDYDATNFPFGFSSLPTDSRTITYPRSNCNPAGIWDAKCTEWDKSPAPHTGLPYNFYEASDGDALKQALFEAISSILSQATSGTAASVSGNDTSSEGMLARNVYFPEKQFQASTSMKWLGELDALWLYVSPTLKYINVREDTVVDNILKLKTDNIVQYDFSQATGLEVKKFVDTHGDGGSVLVATTGSDLEGVSALWKAGKKLWNRTSARKIYTNDPTVPTYAGSLINFDIANGTKLRSYLDVGIDSSFVDTDNIINYVRGVDLSGYRNRTVTIDGISGKVWKLGDNINSTPQILANSTLNDYNEVYRDLSYNSFVATKNYKERGMIFFGANDGMLHAFNTGRIFEGSPSSSLKNPDGTPATALGEEQWAFIPKNALPLLKHLGNPNYRHLYYVDSTASLLDASIGVTKKAEKDSNSNLVIQTCTDSTYSACPRVTTIHTNSNNSKVALYDTSTDPTLASGDESRGTSWRTLLLGGMGLGGSTREKNASCTDCIKAPIDGLGYSSVFALDITEPLTPSLLWEFAHPSLGLSTAGAAVLRIKDASEVNIGGAGKKNGKWFAVLASGPTGPVDTGTNQMKGYSDQPLTVFVLDLKFGTPLRTFSAAVGPVITGVPHTQVAGMPTNAFAGRLGDGTFDAERLNATTLGKNGSYSDDALYFGYTRKDVSAGSPTFNNYVKGGVLRLLTGHNPDPSQWAISTVMDGIGPVTSSVAKFQDPGDSKPLWLFWGTGRYSYKIGASIDEDYPDQREAFYGVTEPCYDAGAQAMKNLPCTDTRLATALTDQTNTVSSSVSSSGFKINLAAAAGTNNAQRVISDPTATPSGMIFFTSFKPSTSICSSGGSTSFWVINYNTGGAFSKAMGMALLQTSTGAMKMVNIKNELVNSSGRESGEVAGVPPGTATTTFTNARHTPIKRILSIQER